MTAEHPIHIDPGNPVVTEETMQAGTYRLRRIDVIEQWERRGEINRRSLEAARHFSWDFHYAGLEDKYGSASMDRVDCSPSEITAERIYEAKERVAQAMRAVGQIAGTVIWDVVGLGKTIQDHAGNSSWKNPTTVKGILIAGLDRLADHYRI